MSNTTKAAPPALYIHCRAIYDKMMERAHEEQHKDGSMIVYVGFLTYLIQELSLSSPYYTFGTKALKEMGCIRQIQRGGGRNPSHWELIKAPTEELFRLANPNDASKAQLGRKGADAMLQAQLVDLTKRVSLLEKAIVPKNTELLADGVSND